MHGNKDLLYKKSIGIVGSRLGTEYGKNMTKYFSKEIALCGIVIVSGLAKGTDSIAHNECVINGGKTIGVLGTGFKYIYPKENMMLIKDMLDREGLIITEYEDEERYDKTHFPIRNRIISGLSEGIIVVEAAIKSGSSITARLAIKQGRKVFAVPGRANDMYSRGTNKLIKNGAILVEDIKDVAQNLDILKLKRKSTNINEEYKAIYELLKQGDLSVEEISNILNEDFFDVLKKLSRMEIDNIVEKDINKYKIKM